MSHLPQWMKRSSASATLSVSVLLSLALQACNIGLGDDAAELSIVEFIDANIQQGYEDNEIKPSAVADRWRVGASCLSGHCGTNSNSGRNKTISVRRESSKEVRANRRIAG